MREIFFWGESAVSRYKWWPKSFSISECKALAVSSSYVTSVAAVLVGSEKFGIALEHRVHSIGRSFEDQSLALDLLLLIMMPLDTAVLVAAGQTMIASII